MDKNLLLIFCYLHRSDGSVLPPLQFIHRPNHTENNQIDSIMWCLFRMFKLNKCMRMFKPLAMQNFLADHCYHNKNEVWFSNS